MKKTWRFRCFRSERGEDLIDTWHGALSKKGRIKFKTTLEYLCAQEKSQWSRPHASPVGNHIYVIRFQDENSTKHRLAGHFHGDSYFFVMTQPIIEKNDEYKPSNYAELAASHKSICDAKFDTRTCDCFRLPAHEREDQSSSTTVNVVHIRGHSSTGIGSTIGVARPRVSTDGDGDDG